MRSLLFLLLAIFGPPVMGVVLAIGIPHPISSNASGIGLLLYPFACVWLMWLAARNTPYGPVQFLTVPDCSGTQLVR